MKFNTKMFKSLQNPVDVYEVEGKTVEIHYMNDTNYLAQFAGQGYFYQWSSDGETYKLLVEKGYYEELEDLFLPESNLIQIKLYENLHRSRKRVFFGMYLPVLALVIAAIAVVYFVEDFQQYFMQVFVVSLIVLIISTLFPSSYLKKKIEAFSIEYSRELEENLGEERFEKLAIKQRKYHEEYFNFEEEVSEPEEEISEEVIEEPQVVPAWVGGSQEEILEATEKEDVAAKKEAAKVVAVKASEDLVSEETLEIAEVVPGEADLSVLGMEELKEFARARKISGFSTMRKGELVEALPNEYAKLKVVELQALAKLQNVSNFSTMRKGELIEALKSGAVNEEILEVTEIAPEKEEVFVYSQTQQIVGKDGSVDLAVLLMNDLKAFAKDRKVTNFSTMRKGELVEALPNNIHDLRLIELKALARQHKLPNFSMMRRDELVAELIKGVPIEEEVVEENVVEKTKTIAVLNEDGTVKFSLLNLEELKEFAKDRKIANFSTMRKGELVEALPKQAEELKMNELKALARVKKVLGFSTMRKGELITAIKEQ